MACSPLFNFQAAPPKAKPTTAITTSLSSSRTLGKSRRASRSRPGCAMNISASSTAPARSKPWTPTFTMARAPTSSSASLTAACCLPRTRRASTETFLLARPCQFRAAPGPGLRYRRRWTDRAAHRRGPLLRSAPGVRRRGAEPARRRAGTALRSAADAGAAGQSKLRAQRPADSGGIHPDLSERSEPAHLLYRQLEPEPGTSDLERLRSRGKLSRVERKPALRIDERQPPGQRAVCGEAGYAAVRRRLVV